MSTIAVRDAFIALRIKNLMHVIVDCDALIAPRIEKLLYVTVGRDAHIAPHILEWERDVIYG